jgi:hypothetical protein
MPHRQWELQTEFILERDIMYKNIPYILESNPHPVFGDFLNEKS